jgi:hypothetical protein
LSEEGTQLIRLLISTAAYLIANSVGLLVAVLLLPGFRIDFMAFITAVLIFSAFQTFAGPLVTKLSLKKMPQLVGGISLVTIFFGLLVTDLIMPRMEMGGIANWLAATLLVWIGALIAALLLPIYVFKQLRDNSKERAEEMERDAERAARAAEQAAASAEAAAQAASPARSEPGKPPQREVPPKST